MRWYWIKIGLGALLIFGVGFGVMAAIRGTRHAIDEMAHAESVSIPLPFVPFVLDGNPVGKFRRVTLHRSERGNLEGVDISVRLSESSTIEGLREGCNLTIDEPRRLGTSASFHCVDAPEGLRQFGNVAIQIKNEDGEWTTRGTYPFVIPTEAEPQFGEAEVASNAAAVEADQIRELADSIASVSSRMGQATAAEREELRDRMRELRSEMREVEAAAAQVSRAMRRVRVRAPGVSVDVEVPEVKVEVRAPEAPAPPGGQ